MAVWNAGPNNDCDALPSERLMTEAPWSAAYLMPAATSSVDPVASHPVTGSHVCVRTLTSRMAASGATPAMPAPLLVVAAAIPATWVPWPLSSWPPSTHFDSSPADPTHV